MNHPFFVIVMPGGVHVAKLAISKIPRSIDTVVILNGLDAWEAAWLEKNVRCSSLIRSPIPFAHATVLDLLFDCVGQDFGILDYDCFVFDPTLFDQIREIAPNVLLNACFAFRNAADSRPIPETFFLYFNRSAVVRIKNTYGVGCDIVRWSELPAKAQSALRKIGIDDGRLPEFHKPNFDTLRAVMMLGLAERYEHHYVIDLPTAGGASNRVFHVGGISDPRNLRGMWEFRGSYFWRRLLEAGNDEALKLHYQSKYGRETSSDLVRDHPALAQEVGSSFLEFCEFVVQAEASGSDSSYRARTPRQ